MNWKWRFLLFFEWLIVTKEFNSMALLTRTSFRLHLLALYRSTLRTGLSLSMWSDRRSNHFEQSTSWPGPNLFYCGKMFSIFNQFGSECQIRWRYSNLPSSFRLSECSTDDIFDNQTSNSCSNACGDCRSCRTWKNTFWLMIRTRAINVNWSVMTIGYSLFCMILLDEEEEKKFFLLNNSTTWRGPKICRT